MTRVWMMIALLLPALAQAKYGSREQKLLCSTYLTQPKKALRVFSIGKRTGRGEPLWDQDPSSPKRVNLNRDFADVEVVSDMISPIGSTLKGYPAEIVAGFAKAEWETRKEDLLFSINYGIMRGPMIDPPKEAADFLKDFGGMGYLLLEPIKTIIEPLYKAYTRQGPERALLLPEILEQDHQEASRYTRFVLSRFIKPMAYAQVLVSQNQSESLHVSQTWGDQVADLVRAKPDEVVGELGRLHLIHPNEYQYDRHSRVVDPVEREAGRLKTNRTVTFLLLQKILSWVNSDARLDRLLIQVNLQVEKVMLMNGVPLKEGVRRELKKTWANGETITEVVYAFDRKALIKAEEILMAQTLSAWLRSVKDQPFFKNAPEGHLVLSFYANELPAVKRLGFYQDLFPDRQVPDDLPGDGFQMYLGQDMIDRVLAFLDGKTRPQ